jgi:uncharacterized protein YdhG (YjbR/CyaY superfamily)
MRKRKSGRWGSAAKARRAPASIDAYLAGLPEPACAMLRKMRAAIRSAVPPETTEGISYGMPVFKYKGPLVWFGAFSNHCSLFPTASVIEVFQKDLKGFSTAKGTIQFPTDKPLPTTLIRKIVEERVAQKEGKKHALRGE